MNLLHFLFTAPASEWLRFVLFLLGIFLFICIAEQTRKVLGWPAEVNRKIVHILTGILIFFSPRFFTSPAPLILLAVLFIIVDAAGIKTGRLKGMHGTERSSYGTVFYPLAFLLLVLFCWQHNKAVLIVSMMILAAGDAGAAIAGESLKSPHTFRLSGDRKSVEGSAVMFAVTFLVVFLLLPAAGRLDGLQIDPGRAALAGLITAVFAMVLEALSSRGSDNLTVPLGSAFIIWFMISQPDAAVRQLVIGTSLASVVAVLSYKARFLTGGGAAAAFLLGVIIFGLGGWAWTIPVMTFFILSSLLSKTGKRKKHAINAFFEKSGCRDLGQVGANGFLAGFLVIMSIIIPDRIWYFAYLGTLAAVNADTWGTELGAFSRHLPVSIRTFQPVPAGTSGGITLIGTAASFIGSFIIVLSGSLAAPAGSAFAVTDPVFWIITAAGFAACLVDSLLGATLQVQYICSVCGRRTENRMCCSGAGTSARTGLAWLNNDRVNMLCAVTGAVISSVFIIFSITM